MIIKQPRIPLSIALADASFFEASEYFNELGFTELNIHCGLSGFVCRLFKSQSGAYLLIGVDDFDPFVDKKLDYFSIFDYDDVDIKLRRKVRNYIRHHRSEKMYKFLDSNDYTLITFILQSSENSIYGMLSDYTYTIWPEYYYPDIWCRAKLN